MWQMAAALRTAPLSESMRGSAQPKETAPALVQVMATNDPSAARFLQAPPIRQPDFPQLLYPRLRLSKPQLYYTL
ncbi:hypothetical protein J2TS4_36370 [Paenibacillus sp. J2TS4]|nr:hypothetical protein J2TS4_36370 [Paenibacillus sp. J2TS4]